MCWQLYTTVSPLNKPAIWRVTWTRQLFNTWCYCTFYMHNEKKVQPTVNEETFKDHIVYISNKVCENNNRFYVSRELQPFFENSQHKNAHLYMLWRETGR